jgi:hypothetical protein
VKFNVMVFYSAKSRDWVFHQERCPSLKNIKADNIRWLPSVYDAWSEGYRHCDCCALINRLFAKEENEIEEYCEEKDVAFSLQNGQMQISTGYSQWKVICEEEGNRYKLVLYHKNTETRKGDELSPIKGYHNQEKRFYKLIDILQYIVRHDDILIQHDENVRVEKEKEQRSRDLIFRTNRFYRVKERNKHSAGQLYSLLDGIETA